MKKISLLVLLCCSFMVLAEPKTELKVMAIGNSFSNNAYRFFGEIIKQHGKAQATLGNASIGGCSFERHWKEHLKSEQDPSHKPYKYKGKPVSLRDYLTAEKWDIVTIQSVSHQSFKPELWQPYADNLAKLIHELAPQARLYIHRTWAYRPDHRFFKPDALKKGETFTPEMMFKQSGEAYEALGKKLGAPLIPAGDAMWAAYLEQPVKPVIPDPDFDYKNPVHPNLPKDPGAIINSYSWRKDKEGNFKLNFDGIHANIRGEYLIGCVWYAFLFEQNLASLSWAPNGIKPEDAAFLRSIAQRIVTEKLKK